MESGRQAWSDERMDEFAERTEKSFKEVRSEVREVRTELKVDISDLRIEMNGRFAKLESTFNRRFDILFGALATGFIGAVVSHFIG